MGKRASVLVVDDDRVIRQSYERSLAGTTCRVRTALDAGEALKLMEEEASDVVLLDIRMPGMDGISLLGELKNRWPECEVVVITGYPTIDSAKEAVRLGANNYLAKPVGPNEVVEATTDAFNRKRWLLRTENCRSDGRSVEYRFPWEN